MNLLRINKPCLDIHLDMTVGQSLSLSLLSVNALIYIVTMYPLSVDPANLNFVTYAVERILPMA